jgi:hypothetical protein
LAPRRLGRSETVALVIAALALATGAAAWIADADQTAALATAALPKALDKNFDRLSFEDRFRPAFTPELDTDEPALEPRDDAALVAREMKLRDAKGLLAIQLASGDWRSPLIDRPKPAAPAAASVSVGIPLPRSRPATVTADARAAAAPAVADNTAAPDNRTIMQKLSDMLPDKIRLASLTPDSGLFRRGPDLAALGYDRQTAVYDITARTVYLPGGVGLEAHSGMGSLKDDPDNVHRRMVGATPPATYDLRPREALFHGVRALRMIPVEGSNTLGRSGLLTHSYMLGPNGDSNGCVSIKNYDRFLKAFDDGEINRIVVVPSLSGTASASQRSTSES